MNRVINFKIDWLFWFILLSPLFFIAGTDLRMSQTMFFQFSVMFLVAIFNVNKWFGAFLGWSVLQYLFFQGISPDTTALNNLFLASVAYQMIVLFCDPDDIKKYFKVFMVVVVLNMAWCLRQFLQSDPVFSMMNYQVQNSFSEFPGFFGLPAFLGNYVSVMVPIALAVNPYLVLVCIAGLLISKSTFACAAALASALFYFWFRKRFVFWLILAVGGFAFCIYTLKFDYPTGQFSRRLVVWESVEKLSFRTPFLGNGIGSFQSLLVGEETNTKKLIVTKHEEKIKPFLVDRLKETGNEDLIPAIQEKNDIGEIKALLQTRGLDFERWQNVHNDFLETFYESGLIGMFFVFGYILNLFKRFFEWGRDCPVTVALMASFVGILVVSIGHFPFHLTRIASCYLVIMALLEVSLLQAQKVKEKGW